MSLLVELDSGPHHWLGGYGPLLAIYWLGEVDPMVLRAFPRVTRAYCAKQQQSKVAVVSLSFSSSRVPGTEAREALVALVKETDANVQRIAVVRECEGFMASIMSSIVAAVQMFAKPNAAHRCFHSIGEAVEWAAAGLSEFKSGQMRPADVALVLERQLGVFKTRYRVAS